MMSVMLCLQMHDIYKRWGVLMVVFLWRELIVKEHSKLLDECNAFLASGSNPTA